MRRKYRYPAKPRKAKPVPPEMPGLSNQAIWLSRAVVSTWVHARQIEMLTKRTTRVVYSNNGSGYSSGGDPCLAYKEPTTDLNGRAIGPPDFWRRWCFVDRAWGKFVGLQDECGRWRTDSEVASLEADRHRRIDLAYDELTTMMEDWWYHRPLKPLCHQPKSTSSTFWQAVGEWLVGGGGGGGRPTPPALVWQAFFQEKEKRQGILGFVPRVPDVSGDRLLVALVRAQS